MAPLPEIRINSNEPTTPLAALAAYRDAVDRSANDLVTYPRFFNRDHMARVQQVRDIVDGFFSVKSAIYVNHRGNRGKPFSVVKVFDIGQWPVKKDKQRDLYAPLQALGVYEVTLSKHGSHYSFRIR